MVSPELVKRAIEAISKGPTPYEYFFDRLNSPDWLVPLKGAGFFSTPPPPRREGKYISFPAWPESRYLARMAGLPEVQETVTQIALAIPETDNVRVHEDLVDVALALPAETAILVIRKVSKWLESSYQLQLPDKLGDLVLHLANAGEKTAAIDLAGKLFSLKTPVGPASESAPEPEGRFDDWHYEKLLERLTPNLVDAAGPQALWLLSDILESAIRTSGSAEAGTQDFSWIWRPAIEDHEQNQRHSIKEYLVDAIRNAAERIVSRDRDTLPTLISEFENRKWPVFRRIALHLLRHTHPSDLDLVEERLTNQAFFEELGIRHEYYLLLQTHFGGLSAKGQTTILSLIENGPATSASAETRAANTDPAPSDSETLEYERRWQLERLYPIKNALPPDWKARYDELSVGQAPPEHPEFPSYSRGAWCGPTSPKTVDQLGEMSTGAIISFLEEWQPSDDWMTPSREGLGRVFSTVVAGKPTAFVESAHAFKLLDPVYVRSFVSGLREAVNHNRQFEWVPVLALCQWVANQPRAIPGRRVSAEDDPDWGWTRKAIADLLRLGFKHEAVGIPFELRESAWLALAPLTDDPEPTPEHEKRYGGSNMDPPTLALNTTRGSAIEAVVAYVLWIRRNLDSQEPTASQRPSFEQMPEAREVLDRHLDAAHDPSLAVRSVYGQWLPWLENIDPEWTAARLSFIFPIDARAKDLRDAAWNSYIGFCRPYRRVFRILKSEYERAVADLATSPEEARMADPRKQLAEHLMLLYWSGELQLEGHASGLIQSFFAKASDALCGHALEALGRWLKNHEGELEQDIQERLRRLWEWRFEVVKQSPTQHSKELAAFGWWFASSKLEETWTMSHLETVLACTSRVEPDHRVVETLAHLAPRWPLQTMRCLRYLIDGDERGWSIIAWRKPATSILQTVLQSDDAAAREAATALIHRLGALGQREFGTILDSRRSVASD